MRKLNETEKQRVRDLLIDLVRIRSAVSSTEQAIRDRAEERMAEFLTGHLLRMGMTVERQEVFPGRPNLMAHWPGQGSPGAPKLMLEAHMDTVTVEGMTIPPFEPKIRDGRIYGRGSSDTKGSMAAFLTALALAKEADELPSDQLYFVATMGEETCCVGAAALMRTGFRTDAAIVGEPTGCQVVTAHKSPLWIDLETHGRSCHASVSHLGVNAIELMSRVVQFVQGPWAEYLRQQQHPLLGRSTAEVTVISGGSKINIVPASCRVQIDSRLLPGLDATQVMDTFCHKLAGHLGTEEAFSITRIETHGSLDTPTDAPLVRRLLEVCRGVHGQEAPRGVDYFANTGSFQEAGIVSVLFGPGDISEAHTADEFLELEQLYQATEIVLSLLTENAGRSIVEG
jgi:acetylornithine deacetylase/succinyl-diaminopimelate desuccinylase family protein